MHQKSCVETLEQNGLVERKHHHILNVARCLKLQSGLPSSFWTYFIGHATHLINRMPTPLLNNKTPFEKLYNKVPSYDDLKSFGCLVFISTLKRERNKFDDRADKGIFVGYEPGVNGFRIYNLKENKVIVSRNVKFYKDRFLAFNDTKEESSQPTGQINNNQDTQLGVRRSKREHRQPSYIQDYHCLLASDSSVTELEQGKLYPLSSVINYDKYSKDHRTFSIAISAETEPKTYSTTAKNKNWLDAMQEELRALESNNTWDIVAMPKDKTTIGCKWVYKIKRKSDGTIERYKARLVAKGYTQQNGINYLENFSPVAKIATIRLLLALAAKENWNLEQLNINNTFLHGSLDKEIYMQLPPGMSSNIPNPVCKLKKVTVWP